MSEHTQEPSPVCKTPGCGKNNGKRQLFKGLCSSCYGQARHLIDASETTWEELAEMDMIVPEWKPFTSLFRAKKRNRPG